MTGPPLIVATSILSMHSFGTLMRFIWRSSRRAAVFVVGVVLVAVGAVMFVTPGPGIVLVVAGLAVLATEFAWAEHLLDKAKDQAAKAGRSAQRVPGVAKVAAGAGRLVPQRWRRTVATSVVVTETTHDGVTATRTTFSSATITTLEGATAPGAGATGDTTRFDADAAGADADGADTAGSDTVIDVTRPDDIDVACPADTTGERGS